jgi:hypothetical protein
LSDERRFGWLGAVALFLAGCVVTFLVLRYWPGAGTSLAPVAQQTSKSRWGFEADFQLLPSHSRPIIVSSPDKTDILKFEIHRPKLSLEPYPVSIKNLSDRAYPVTYEIFAYDAQKRRVDEASDSVTIGAKETVLRQLGFDHPASVDARTFASFRLVADIEH